MTINFPSPKIIKTNGINMEVFEQGEGFPVVMAHGFPELAYSWRLQIPVLAAAGYRVIAPNQRGFGETDKPEAVEEYDLAHLCGDLAGLLDALDIEKAVFVGHDWGGPVVWRMPLLYPERVAGVVGLSVDTGFMVEGSVDPIEYLEQTFGPEHYVVHFNRQPGVADAAFAANPRRLLGNLFSIMDWASTMPDPNQERPAYNASLMALLSMPQPMGKPLMSDAELDVFVAAFEKSGFTGGINWYRNITRNWQASAVLSRQIDVPCGMIYGQYDIVPRSADFSKYVPDLEIITLSCGHWIQQEKPEEVNTFLLDWLKRNAPSEPI